MAGPAKAHRADVQRRDGTPFQAELSAAALMADNQALYTIYLRDITDRKRLETERETLLAQTRHCWRTRWSGRTMIR